jgi:hypothetical protein
MVSREIWINMRQLDVLRTRAILRFLKNSRVHIQITLETMLIPILTTKT